jgi:heavy metal sensor kinase
VPIRLRLAIIFAAAAAVAAALGGWIFVGTLSNSLHSSLMAELQTRAGTVSQQLQNASPVGGRISLGGPDLADSQPITQVVSNGGKVLATSGPTSGLLSPTQLQLARHGSITYESRLPGTDASSLILAEPASDGKPFIVVVGASLATVNSAVQRVETEILVGGIVGVLAAGVAAWFLARAALTPVERMRRQATAISALDQQATLEVPHTRDEVAALATTFNDLLRRLQDALRRQRSFVAVAGHELRTPLAILTSELELAGRPGRSRAELALAIEEATGETDRLVQLAEDLLVLAQSDESASFVQLGDTDLVPVIGLVMAASESRLRARDVSLHLSAPAVLVATADATRIRQAIENVVDNAIRFSPAGSTVTITLRRDGDAAVVEVVDQGPGLPPDFLPRAFERFSRPDGNRDRNHGGSGLGLAIVQTIVHAHGGHVEIGNAPEGGAQVTLCVPAPERGPTAAHDGLS